MFLRQFLHLAFQVLWDDHFVSAMLFQLVHDIFRKQILKSCFEQPLSLDDINDVDLS